MNEFNTDQIPPSKDILDSFFNRGVFPMNAGNPIDVDYTAMNTPNPDVEFVTAWNYQAHMAHQNAKEKGFWEQDRNDGEMIALCHSELSEALEALRHGNGPSEHIPAFSGVEEEFADIVIRIFDMSEARGWKIPEAILEKMKYNRGRPTKHGKEF